MPQFGAVFPLWSFSGANDSLLERLRHEVGLDYITIPVITGPVSAFRVAPHHGPHAFHSAGGWHYRSRRGAYAGTEIKPRIADWIKGRDPLAQLMDAAAELGMHVAFEVDIRSALSADPHAARTLVRNLWDEPLVTAGPCPLHPEVEAIAEGVFSELAEFQPAAIIMPEWPLDPSTPESRDLHEPGRRPHTFWNCYCVGCLHVARAAGLDPELVRRHAQADFEQANGLAPAPPLTATRHDRSGGLFDEQPNEYADVRRRAQTKFLQDVARRHAATQLYLTSTRLRYPVPGWGTHFPCSPETGARAPGQTTNEPAPKPYAARIFAATTTESDAPKLVQTTRQAAEIGAERIEFDGVDAAIPDLCIWLKQAVRFAGRETML
jgi:hypothetical protein